MKIDFEFTTQYGVFCDALYLDDDHGLSNDEINALKQERLDSWIFAIENPPIPEENIVTLDGVRYQKRERHGQIILTPLEA